MAFWNRRRSIEAITDIEGHARLKPTMSWPHLIALGVGAIVGTGIYTLIGVGAAKAGPAVMLAFLIAGLVCVFAALAYAELATMIPAAGSAYTYSYAALGELLAWVIGWSLILEYSLVVSAVAVGWSGYFNGFLESMGWGLPAYLTSGPFGTDTPGLVNLPAVGIVGVVAGMLMLGTRESATVNAVLVVIKVVALTAFIILAVPVMKMENFEPFAPLGFAGVSAAAASIFFAYVGFDAVSTAAEETKNPQRNMPIGLIGSLVICTVFYLLVAAGAIGAVGAQPVMGAAGEALAAGSKELQAQCAALAGSGNVPLVCSDEALAHVLREIGYVNVGNLIGLAAFLALPSVVLMMLFGQTRIFFVMARDGLLPEVFSRVHPKWKTPHIVTLFTGIAVAVAGALFPVGQLADISNSGTLFAFFMVSIAVLILRVKEPNRHRPFKTPLVWIMAPLSAAGCAFLFWNLPHDAKMVLPIWGGIGLVVYLLYGVHKSHVGRGIVDVPELDPNAPQVPVPPMPGASTPGEDNG